MIIAYALAAALSAGMGFAPANAFAQDPTSRPAVQINHSALSSMHWQLACQTSTFSNMPFDAMIDQLHEMGFHHVTLSPGQPLSADSPNVVINEQMSDEQIALLQEKLRSAKMDVVSYGSVNIGNESGRNRAIFEFAARLKAKNIVVIPTNVSLESLDKLANRFGIHIAILTQFDAGWTCDTFLQLLKGRSPMIGLCLDISSLRRAGFAEDQCIDNLKERIVEINLTDETDVGSLQAVLTQLREQNFRGIFELQCASERKLDRMEYFARDVNAFTAAINKVFQEH